MRRFLIRQPGGVGIGLRQNFDFNLAGVLFLAAAADDADQAHDNYGGG